VVSWHRFFNSQCQRQRLKQDTTYLCRLSFQACQVDHQGLANPADLLTHLVQADHSDPALPSGLETLAVRLVQARRHLPLDQAALKITDILASLSTTNTYFAGQLNDITTLVDNGE